MTNNQTQNQESNIRKVALTALAGTSIEWYDFFLYGAAAALIFPKAFFPEATPTTALLLSFGSFAVGFIARPVGGIIFGHSFKQRWWGFCRQVPNEIDDYTKVKK